MILLDTNVVSAVMKPTLVEPVLEWLDARDTASLYLSAVTIAEIRFGLRVLPEGRRRRSLEKRFEQFVALGFDQRILAFDEPAARAYAEIMGHRRELGRPMSALDGQIAATARTRRFSVATGNVRDFEECGIQILNPFES